MRNVTVAATQMACSDDREVNFGQAESLIRRAAAEGAHIILIQELFEGPYFCKDQSPENFALARPFPGNEMIERMQVLAAELEVVLPLSFFEQAGNTFFNSLAMVDADGSVLGLYRKSHIPDGPGYQEKFYFAPGDTGFKVWQTCYGTLGVGVCWDQWFPEAARSMALMGAEILLYPTAIGSEPMEPELDSRDHWQRVMQGHSGANILPVVASNRVGTECGRSCEITFYGSSFITDHLGAKVAEAPRKGEAILTASFDLDAIAEARRAWGVFRDRRPDLYDILCTYGGSDSQG